MTLFVCRRRSGDDAVLVREARREEAGMPLAEAFRRAKKAAKWLREIPAVDGEHAILIDGEGFLSVEHRAICSCGWSGPERYNAYEARNDGRGHQAGTEISRILRERRT